MNFLKKNRWPIIAAIVWIPATIFIWEKMVTDPGNILLDLGGDSGKNYFTYLFHSLYDEGIWFRGMNYPYGEHIVYTDAQPLLSVPLTYIPGVNFQVALGMMHLLLVFGFVLGLVFVYKLLIHFKVHPAAAIFFSLLIVIISPQVSKVFGHFGLSYMCVIPMLFLWTIKYHEQHKLKYTGYIFALGCVVSFLHPYFAAVVLIWSGIYAVSYALVVRERFLCKLKHAAAMLLAAGGVALIVKLAMALTDPVKDRPDYPSGMLEGLTHIVDIFSFRNSPISQYLDKRRWLPLGPPSEGATYPGVVVIVVVIVSLLALLLNGVKRASVPGKTSNTQFFSPVWLLMALFALLLGMGVPYIWNMEWLIGYASIFRQFRTLGRFSWIFYYIITIYTVVVMYHWVLRQNGTRKIIASCVALLAAAIWSFEASGYVKDIHARLEAGLYNNYLFLSRVERNWNLYLEAQGYKAKDFQAVIAVPYTHVGSEKIWLIRDGKEEWLQVLGWRVCVQTGLPMANVMMSRSSWGQMLKQVRIAGGPYADKPIFAVKDERPFLLLTMETDSLNNPDDKWLVENSEFIGAHGDLKAYKLYPAKIRAIESNYKQQALQLVAAMKQQDSSTAQPGQWYVNHFGSGSSRNVLFGTGALATPKTDTQLLAKIPFAVPDSGARYECSAWVLVNSTDYRTPHLLLEYYDTNGHLLSRDIIHVSKATDNYKMWFRASGYYTFPRGCAKVECKIINGPVCEGIDELLIRPADATVISKTPNGTVMANNHLLKP